MPAAALPAVEILVKGVINPAIKFLMAAAVLYFLWGVFGYMRNREDEEKKKHLLWGIIGLVIVVGAFGIVNLIGGFVETVGS